MLGLRDEIIHCPLCHDSHTVTPAEAKAWQEKSVETEASESKQPTNMRQRKAAQLDHRPTGKAALLGAALVFVAPVPVRAQSAHVSALVNPASARL